MDVVKGPLKRESKSEKTEEKEHDNIEYPQAKYQVDEKDFPSSIEHLEDEYREYIDSKYANAQEKMKPMERFTISKTAETGDKDYTALDYETGQEKIGDDAQSVNEGEGTAEMLKREQVTLYDGESQDCF